MQLILGSSSKFRRNILESNNYKFTTISPDINEKTIGINHRNDINADALVLEISHAKADKIVEILKNNQNISNAIIITSDQVVLHNGIIREKPKSKQEAREYLSSYEKIPAETHSAIVLTLYPSNKRVDGVDIARQWFKYIPDDIVDQVIEEGEVFYCSGGFMIDNPILQPYLGKREGDEDSIIGFPLELFKRLMAEIESQVS